MLFQRLNPSAALNLVSYADIDHFRESERYVSAVSMPLNGGDFSVRRAEFVLPSCTLSLVRTFPRIINGYQLSGQKVVVIPMSDVSSARINGEQIGASMVALRGNAECTVYEPEGRLVAIVSARQGVLDDLEPNPHRGYRLIGLPSHERMQLQALIADIVELAAWEPEASRLPEIRIGLQETLLKAIARAICLGEISRTDRRDVRDRYKAIVDRIDNLIVANPAKDLSCEQLADEIGASARTIQTATQLLCGTGTHHYSRLKRLWMVRRQLRTGAAGLTIKASAIAHGFCHMGEFSNVYWRTFGELPSQTLAAAR
jgi:AraC family ethanolamine operon transcriptional activator